jgi:hypothetical protein
MWVFIITEFLSFVLAAIFMCYIYLTKQVWLLKACILRVIMNVFPKCILHLICLSLLPSITEVQPLVSPLMQ